VVVGFDSIGVRTFEGEIASGRALPFCFGWRG
jgi:hypothetical protein